MELSASQLNQCILITGTSSRGHTAGGDLCVSAFAEGMCLDRYIQPTEAELWDVWTDVHCMMDISSGTEGMCLDRYIQPTEAELWDVWTDVHCMMDISSGTDKSITPAGHRAGAQGGPHDPPHLLTHTTAFIHIAEIWLDSNQQPLKPRGSALTCEPQISCLNM
ncbi:uncharacterized protein LOC143741954 isoform X4 [Siphateles boraxobius]|uniref:uncharacterized protein LOC143741954 isoform X4 n=1 Tax=Siphateles boraxobius TaxID=180520 RepID=UPI004063371E